jgi:hypothetical protein
MERCINNQLEQCIAQVTISCLGCSKLVQWAAVKGEVPATSRRWDEWQSSQPGTQSTWSAPGHHHAVEHIGQGISRASPRMEFFFSRIFPWPFVLAGVVALYLGCRNLQQAKASTTWPATQGVVQHSAIKYRHGDEGDRTYHAEVVYVFELDGHSFTGERVGFGDYGSSSSAYAQRIVNTYTAGKKVTVYYMQENPGNCVLEPGVPWKTWLLPAGGLVFFLVGSRLVVLMSKLPGRNERTEDPAGNPQ